MSIEIKALGECLEHKNTVIEWMNNEFGNPSSYNFYRDIVEHSMKTDQLPITFVMVEGDKLFGTVGIWRGDLLSRQDLFPWLSALIVNAKYRNRGIGTELQNHVLKYCKQKGLKEIYLYTDIEKYYEKNEWIKYGVGYEYSGNKITIYRHQVN